MSKHKPSTTKKSGNGSKRKQFLKKRPKRIKKFGARIVKNG